MNNRSVLDNSLDKKKDWLEKLHKTLKESQHSTIVFTLQNESAIRCCIKQTWEDTREGSEKGMRALFQKRPSNLVFIRKLCDYIENEELHFCK